MVHFLQALRRNRFAPRVPCHRVVAATLDLGGYCGDSVRIYCTPTNHSPQLYPHSCACPFGSGEGKAYLGLILPQGIVPILRHWEDE